MSLKVIESLMNLKSMVVSCYCTIHNFCLVSMYPWKFKAISMSCFRYFYDKVAFNFSIFWLGFNVWVFHILCIYWLTIACSCITINRLSEVFDFFNVSHHVALMCYLLLFCCIQRESTLWYLFCFLGTGTVPNGFLISSFCNTIHKLES